MVKVKPISGLYWVVHYYYSVCFGPIRTNISWKWPPILILLYIFPRFIGLSKMIYLFLLVLGTFDSIHGPMDIFGYIEACLWFTGMLPYLGSDTFLLSPDFIRNVDKLFVVFEKVFEETEKEKPKNRPKVWLENARHEGAYKTLHVFMFSSFLDHFQNFNTFIALKDIMHDRCHMYSILPWQSPFLETIAWFLESFNLSILFFVISVVTTLPGCFAYYLEECLRRMAEQIEEKGLEDEEERNLVLDMLDRYEEIFLIVRELNKTMGMGVMVFHSIYNVQQSAETYCIFRMLRAGASFGDIQFLFTDIILSASRIMYSFHSLSVVESACQDFVASVKSHLSRKLVRIKRKRRVRDMKELKLIKVKLRSLQEVCMTIGPCKCGSDLVLQGMAVYFDHYSAAALWP
ncbi:unnamed protein product [Orchesella dallaii]|uniref:Odorant receptor n=1 Tax=Orchesella dallaii TaxID=48710 RepID=A0ABP1R6K4_9HEXA